MERLFQGSSTGKLQPASSSPIYEKAEDPWKSYDKYWSRDQNVNQNTGSAVKRFTTSGGAVINTSGVLCTILILSYPVRGSLLSDFCCLHSDIVSS